MLGSWVRIPAGSQKQAKKQSKLLKFKEFREFLFSGKTSKTADSGDQSENTHFSGHGRSVPKFWNKRNLPTWCWKVPFVRASCRIRTNDPEITNHVLWPAELKRQIPEKRVSWLCRTATTTYPCCLPTLGGFCRSWSHRTYPGTKVQKNILLTNIWNTFYQKIFPIIIKQLYTNK